MPWPVRAVPCAAELFPSLPADAALVVMLYCQLPGLAVAGLPLCFLAAAGVKFSLPLLLALAAACLSRVDAGVLSIPLGWANFAC